MITIEVAWEPPTHWSDGTPVNMLDLLRYDVYLSTSFIDEEGASEDGTRVESVFSGVQVLRTHWTDDTLLRGTIFARVAAIRNDNGRRGPLSEQRETEFNFESDDRVPGPPFIVRIQVHHG